MISLLYMILAIACLFSIVGCVCFLLLFIKIKTIRLTFGMKHVAILQTIDLFFTFTILFQIIDIHLSTIECEVLVFSCHFLALMQAYWVSIISTYNYQVIYKALEKEKFLTLKPALVGAVISAGSPSLALSFGCYKKSKNTCIFQCSEKVILTTSLIMCFIIFSCFLWSFYTNFKALQTIRKQFYENSNRMRWTFARLWVYPFISFVCCLPWVISYVFYSTHTEWKYLIHVSASILFSLVGFFDSICLGFTPELKEAIRIDEDLKKQSIIYRNGYNTLIN